MLYLEGGVFVSHLSAVWGSAFPFVFGPNTVLLLFTLPTVTVTPILCSLVVSSAS
jgi:hypothetical protein